jgi:probable HAF family extracellular repeat protein
MLLADRVRAAGSHELHRTQTEGLAGPKERTPMRRSRSAVGCLAAVALASLATAAVGLSARTNRQAKSVSDLTLGGSGNDGLSIAFDVNAKGRVVGGSAPNPRQGSTDAEHAFTTVGNHVVDLGTLDVTFGEAHGVNREGSVVGWSYGKGSTEFRAFLAKKGRMIDIGTLGGLSSFGMSINDSGEVVGASTISGSFNDGAQPHAFAWAGGAMIDLGTLGGSMSWAQDVTTPVTSLGSRRSEEIPSRVRSSSETG